MNLRTKGNSSANKSCNNRIQELADGENNSSEIALSQFERLSREELLALWMQQMKHSPPKGISRSLVLRAIAYEIQRKTTGGLTRHELRALCRSAESESRGPPINEGTDWLETPDTSKLAKDLAYANKPKRKGPKLRRALKPGTRLVRNWQGKAHVVEVHAAGFGWNGNVYKSLTVVAEKITGMHQSGPRFFRT